MQFLNRKNHSQILVFLIVFFAVIVAMGVSFLYSGRSRTNIIAVQIDRTQAEEASRSGTDIGLRKVTEDKCIAWPGASLTIGGAEVDITVAETTQEYNVTSYATKGRAHSTVSETVTKPEIIGWAKAYGRASYNETFNELQQTSDGGYILGGHFKASGFNNYDFFVIKTDMDGDLETGCDSTCWAKTYGGTVLEMFTTLQQTADGGYILGGSTDNSFDNTYDFLVIKTDADGDVAAADCDNPPGVSCWVRTYNYLDQRDNLSVIQQTSDGGYILGGSTLSALPRDIIFIKTDPQGVIEWAMKYDISGDTTSWDSISSFQQTEDGYILVGDTDFSSGNDDLLMIKTNSQGVVVWANIYIGAEANERVRSLQQTADGGYIFGGYTESPSFSAGERDFFVIKTDSNGNLDTSFSGTGAVTYGGAASDELKQLKQTADGGYILTGSAASFRGSLAIKINSQADIQWAKTYDAGVYLQQTKDGYILGDSSSTWTSDVDYFLIKTDFLGNLECCSIYQEESLSPNNVSLPVNEVTTLVSEDISSDIDGLDLTSVLTVSDVISETTSTPICPE